MRAHVRRIRSSHRLRTQVGSLVHIVQSGEVRRSLAQSSPPCNYFPLTVQCGTSIQIALKLPSTENMLFACACIGTRGGGAKRVDKWAMMQSLGCSDQVGKAMRKEKEREREREIFSGRDLCNKYTRIIRCAFARMHRLFIDNARPQSPSLKG